MRKPFLEILGKVNCLSDDYYHDTLILYGNGPRYEEDSEGTEIFCENCFKTFAKQGNLKKENSLEICKEMNERLKHLINFYRYPGRGKSRSEGIIKYGI